MRVEHGKKGVHVTAFLVLFSTDIVDICKSFVRVNDEVPILE
jgi:hypothetical protein